MTYIDVLGHSTWASISEKKADSVLLLHGGLNGSDTFTGVGDGLAEKYRVSYFDRRGHGKTADTPEPFHYEAMADETIAVLESIGGTSHIVGWSDGGNIGLIVAMRRPDLVKRLVVIGANFKHEAMLDMGLSDDSPAMQMMVAKYMENSPDGPEHFEDFVTKSLVMWGAEPNMTIHDLSTIKIPVLVMVGDDDAIELSHTCEMYESIPGAQLAVIPGTSHGLPLEKPAEVARLVDEFFSCQLPVETMIPIRRR
jgi:pimeloyl-ACP methyl ester carboxylesterase